MQLCWFICIFNKLYTKKYFL